MKIATVAVLLLVACQAWATGKPPPEPPEEPPTANATSASESAAKARSRSESKAKASSKSVADASNSVTVGMETGDTVVEVAGDTEIYDFPSNSAYAPPAFSNIKCADVLGFGYTNQSGSGSVGLPVPRWLSRKIQDCEANADANWLAELGLPLAAIEARCATRSMRKRFGGGSKSPQAQTEGCIGRLRQLAQDEAELEGLRNVVDQLGRDNERLRDELEQASTTDEALADCNKARQRTEEAWRKCQQK